MTNPTVQSVRAMPGSTAESSHSETLEISGVRKGFGEQVVLRGVSLSIKPGEFFTLLGPSGCGKTTLLRIISGLEREDEGRVVIGTRDVTGEPPERRPFNMVFQSYALFPHLNVAENVAYGLRVRGIARRAIDKRVQSALELVDLAEIHHRSVVELSGGQRQRIALARAIVNEPTVLLLDEPLGALDLKLRKRLQEELRTIQQRVGTTFVYVTHDQEEALSLSDRIAVMQRGRLAQVGSPEDIYSTPTSRFVAEFIGETNLVPAQMSGGGSSVARLQSGRTVTVSGADPNLGTAAELTLAIRPEHLAFVPLGEGHLRGRVLQTTYLGSVRRYLVALSDGTELRVVRPAGDAHHDGEVAIRIEEGKAIVLGREVDDTDEH